jgi:hypothetical protein
MNVKWGTRRRALWEAARMDRLSSFCIYTILHSDTLRRQAADGGRGELTEHKAWKMGSQLRAEAERSGEQMPIVFADADGYIGLCYWATIDNIEVDYERRQTTCRYSNLREITPPKQLSALRLKNGNRRLSDDFIRPYAICHTPSFLA